MKYINKIILLTVLPIVLMSCNSNENESSIENQYVIENINAAKFKEKLENSDNHVLIDVRTPDEFDSGHINSALNIDIYNSNFENEISKLEREKPVFLYCRSGGRSATAANKLKELGFKTIYNLEGGITAWNSNQFRIETLENTKNEDNTSSLKGLNINSYNKLTVEGNRLVLIDFNADWCGPCKKLSPILEKVVNNNKDKVKLIKIDVDENPLIAQELKVQGLPTLKLYKNGEEVWQFLGLTDETTILEAIKNNS